MANIMNYFVAQAIPKVCASVFISEILVFINLLSC